MYFISWTTAVLMVFANADEMRPGENECQRAALYAISETGKEVVELEPECMILSWKPFTDPDDSEL